VSDRLVCTALLKRFGRTEAVRHGSLVVDPGRIISLLGPSGCGKTTLLRMIAGFETPDAGTIELGDRVLSGPAGVIPPERRRIGMVFQDFTLFPHMSVADNVGFALTRKGQVEMTGGLLELVGLAGLGDRMPHELSGGQQQRVALARALAAEPEVLLLDEPFSNLDPGLRVRVREELRGILDGLGTTTVFVTHDQEEALAVADRVAVMLDGRVLQEGAPSEVYSRPASREVAEFIGDANFLPGEVDDGAVSCELGSFTVPGARRGRVEVMVRPEDLALVDGGGLPARTLRREFYGHDQMLTVALPSGRAVRVRLGPGEVAPGDPLGVAVKGDVLVFPAAN
jgi:iron(III) transport system ATP-binding protein